jgi:hypothetical protein
MILSPVRARALRATQLNRTVRIQTTKKDKTMETDQLKNEVKNEARNIKEEFKNDLKKTVGTNPDRNEGPLARAIESQTARIPSDVFLWTSAAAMATSLTLKLMGKSHVALFIGQWVAPFLLFGIYNKLVKTQGHDMETSIG